jgi:hypothetical protein
MAIHADGDTTAAKKLRALQRKLEFLRNPEIGLIWAAERELRAKEGKNPGDLAESAKLYRAIDDLECARDALDSVISELRNMSGWHPGQ